jgi:hypothetical protein
MQHRDGYVYMIVCTTGRHRNGALLATAQQRTQWERQRFVAIDEHGAPCSSSTATQWATKSVLSIDGDYDCKITLVNKDV